MRLWESERHWLRALNGDFESSHAALGRKSRTALRTERRLRVKSCSSGTSEPHWFRALNGDFESSHASLGRQSGIGSAH